MTARIFMWSGPRNVSTAMMRAFENRPDCTVSDEPFYAAYLAATGLDHPMREAVLAAQPQDWHAVAAAMTGAAPGGAALWYQKHMAHHMLADVGLGWTAAGRNAFLIRAPEEVLASYVARRETVTLDDIGIVRQAEIFDRVAERDGAAPPVIEGRQVLADPPAALRALCAALGIGFDDRMLRWPAGPRASDGVWAPAWYDAVQRSTGFGPPGAPSTFDTLPDRLKPIADAARPHYERLARFRLAIGGGSTPGSGGAHLPE